MFQDFKRLFKHSIIYGFGNIASKAIGFLMIPVYTRYLTPSDYGAIELVVLTSWLGAMLIGMSLGAAIPRFYFEYEDQKDRKEVVSTTLIFSIVSALLGMLVLVKFAKGISLLVFGNTECTYFFQLIFIASFFDICTEIPSTYLRTIEKSIFFIGLSLFRLILGLSLNIYLIVVLKMGILGVLYSALFSAIGSFAILIPYIFKKVQIHFSRKKLREMLRYSLPLIPASLAMLILTFANRFFLKHFTTLETVGLYSLGYKFGFMLNFLIIQPFLLIWFPFAFSVMKKANVRQIYSRVLTYFGFILILVGLGIAVVIKDVIKLIATPPFFNAYKVVPIIIAGYVCYGAYPIFQIGIRIKKKTELISYILWCVVLANLLLNWILIPRYGMMGAGMATFFCFFVLALTTYFISQKIYIISYEFNRFLIMLFVAVFIYICAHLINIDTTIYSILSKSLLVLSFPILLYFMRFYEKEELNKFKELLHIGFSKIQLFVNQNIVKAGRLNGKG